MMCRVLKVSRSSYNNWLSGRCFKREAHKRKLEALIREVYFEHKQRYGSPRISIELQKRGIKVSGATVGKYMRIMNIRSRRKNKYVVTTDSKHSYRVFPNLLNRRFNKRFKYGAWVSDITYIQTTEGFMYQTAIIDLCDRKVIGWSNSDGMSAAETTVRAFTMAVNNRPPQKGLLFHSDRGVQYACSDFVNLLKDYNVRQSMSRKGNCWDNAVAESYFKTLKSELLYGNKLVSRAEMSTKLFDYIEIYYNKNRRHSALGNMTIKEFEENKKNNNKKYKKTA